MPKETARFTIAGLLVACSGAVYYFVATGWCSPEWKDLVNLIVGALIANLTTVVSYYFGSSQGSKEKTEAMVKLIESNGS